MGSINCAQIPLLSPAHEDSYSEDVLRWQERQKERARIARELHDTLFQGFVGASLLVHRAVEETPSSWPSRDSLVRALAVMQRVIEEGRLALQGLRSSPAGPNSLETALFGLREELVLGAGMEFRVLVTGRPRTLSSDLCEQLYLIAREAVANSLRHSGAATVEIELEYTPRRIKLAIRDDGCGMDQQGLPSRANGHWGLLGMRERAESIGARLRLWSKVGAGTEIEISLKPEAQWSGTLRPVV